MSLTRRKFIQGVAIGASGIVFAESVGFERYFIETNEFYIGGASKEKSNIKIMQISDLHLRSIRYPHKHLAKQINKIRPDLVAFTGDSIDRHGKIWVLEHFLKRIDKRIKKVAIMGNWEYWSNLDINELKQAYANYNCRLLINETEQFSFNNKTLSVTGVDDFVAGNPDIKKALEDYKKSDYHIILNHCPQYSDTISQQISNDINVDFILSGHTHGGQITLFGLIPFLPNGSGGYIKGWYHDRIPKMYVSKGIGTTMLPARLGARAEVAVFNLEA